MFFHPQGILSWMFTPPGSSFRLQPQALAWKLPLFSSSTGPDLLPLPFSLPHTQTQWLSWGIKEKSVRRSQLLRLDKSCAAAFTL